MLRVEIASEREIAELSKLSRSLGNIPLFPGRAMASLLKDGSETVGFAAVQEAWLAAGSWVKEGFRKKGYTYDLRKALDNELRGHSVPLYLALPQTDFEKMLFAKYGPVTERTAQVRHL